MPRSSNITSVLFAMSRWKRWAAGRRDQAVTAAPYNECRLRHLGDPMSLRGVLSLLFPLPPTLDERVTIALAFGDLPGADDHLICDLARVAEDVTQTLLDEPARNVFRTIQLCMGRPAK